MKKIYCFLLTAVFLFATACGRGEADENKGAAELPPVAGIEYNYGKYVCSEPG